MSTSYKNLIVWQKSIELVVEIYRITTLFPKSELYGLVSQMRRCAVSIASNIAEGYRRRSEKERNHFLLISFGSGAELETQIVITKRLDFINPNEYNKAEGLLDEVMRMLNNMTSK